MQRPYHVRCMKRKNNTAYSAGGQAKEQDAMHGKFLYRDIQSITAA